jgi:hypothetical protein
MLSPVSLLVYTPKVYQRKEECEEKKKKTSTNEPSSFWLGENKTRTQARDYGSSPSREKSLG